MNGREARDDGERGETDGHVTCQYCPCSPLPSPSLHTAPYDRLFSLDGMAIQRALRICIYAICMHECPCITSFGIRKTVLVKGSHPTSLAIYFPFTRMLHLNNLIKSDGHQKILSCISFRKLSTNFPHDSSALLPLNPVFFLNNLLSARRCSEMQLCW